MIPTCRCSMLCATTWDCTGHASAAASGSADPAPYTLTAGRCLSCVTPLSAVGKKKIVTLEGLGTTDKPHPVQKAFIEEQAAQCGYCINGMIMEAAALLASNKRPSDTQIKQALTHNLCRCGTHLRIVRAVKRAAAGV